MKLHEKLDKTLEDQEAIKTDIDTVKQQGTDTGTQLNAQQQLQLAGMQGQSDTYAAILAMQETINAQQQLIIAQMQGLSDVYATLLALQTNSTDA